MRKPFDICSLILTKQSIELSYSRAGNIAQFSQLGNISPVRAYLLIWPHTDLSYLQEHSLGSSMRMTTQPS